MQPGPRRRPSGGGVRSSSAIRWFQTWLPPWFGKGTSLFVLATRRTRGSPWSAPWSDGPGNVGEMTRALYAPYRARRAVRLVFRLFRRIVRPRAAQIEAHERLPHSKLDLVDVGHFTWEDAADQYAEIVSQLVEGRPRASMRAITYTRLGDPSVLELVEKPTPEPGDGEVRIRLLVSGVNPTDWKSRSGAFGGGPTEATVPNHDGAGLVDAVGAGVTGFSRGDRVWV